MNYVPQYALPKGYRLEEYEIISVLGAGGFSVTYLATDPNLGKQVAISEHFPDDFAVRDGLDCVSPRAPADIEDFNWCLDLFLEEAETLAGFHHRNVVQVKSFFRANGTAYLVMEYVEGKTLGKMLSERGTLSKDELWEVLDLLFDELEMVHGHGHTHQDIKPNNIILRDGGSPVLIGFDAARRAMSTRTKSIHSVVGPFCPAIEQYVLNGIMGPWTDIFSLAGVAYNCITGVRPEEVTERVRDDPMVGWTEGVDGYEPAFLAAIDAGLAVDPKDRPQSIAQWRQMIENPELIKVKSDGEDVSADQSWLQRLLARLGFVRSRRAAR